MKCNDFSGPERTGEFELYRFLKRRIYTFEQICNLDNEWIIIINLKPFPTGKTAGKWLEVLNSCTHFSFLFKMCMSVLSSRM